MRSPPRNRGITVGGIGVLHTLARHLGLIEAIDRRLNLLKIHLPYHESDHVLALAYLPLCGGTCLQDLELLRHDEVLLDALGARRIPNPTTAGDFCRRFSQDSIQTLLDLINDTRIKVWASQPATFLAQLHGGVRALRAPVDNLDSNGAFMVMTALVWNLKAWWALSLPEEPGRWQEKYRAEKRWGLQLEFKAFVNAFVRLPCQIIRTGRKLVYRLLGWNPQQPIFFRLVAVLRC